MDKVYEPDATPKPENLIQFHAGKHEVMRMTSDRKLVFFNDADKQIGLLSFHDDKIDFDGDCTKSAMGFMYCISAMLELSTRYKNQLKESKESDDGTRTKMEEDCSTDSASD